MRKRPAHNKLNLLGIRFGKLTVIKETQETSKWECVCDCGDTRVVHSSKLRSRRVYSCHKCSRMRMSQKKTKHGEAKTLLYGVWNTMKQRCSNKNTKMYYRYGARGITVCKEWSSDFMAFKRFADENGYTDGMSIERKDNDKGYTIENCTFIPLSEQPKHRECVVVDDDRAIICRRYQEEDIAQSELAREYMVHPTTITNILKDNNIQRQKRNQAGVWTNV